MKTNVSHQLWRWVAALALLLAWSASVAAPPPIDVRLSEKSRYLGRGPVETGIEGLHDEAEVYREEVEVTFDLKSYGFSPDAPGGLAREGMSQFEKVARDYEYFNHISPLVREAWGYRSGDGGKPQISPLEFIRRLTRQTTPQGRPLLIDRRVQEIALDLIDNHAMQRGTLLRCQDVVHDYLEQLTGRTVADRTNASLREAILATPGGAIRERMQQIEPQGCTPETERDYLYLSYGVGLGSEGSWFVLEYDYAPPPQGANSWAIEYEKIAGPSRYFVGYYLLDVDPSLGTMRVRGGYTIDLSLWPERVVTRAHEQFLLDFVHVLHERFVTGSRTAEPAQ
ncbi:MAG: hypothetical protein H6739_22525 [Alphaproteobacteria bacterium]|nr:hypothetical protein [Alphaproteobacteria bacterium]